MFKFFLRWIDSWSTTQTSETNESDTFKTYKDTKIQWLRILPFIFLHTACLAVFWVDVS